MHSLPFLVSSLGRLVMKFALQHYAIFLWCSSLCGLLYFWHLDLCAWHVNIVWPYFQQFLYFRTLRFILISLIVAICHPKLKLWLISCLAFMLFCESQILTYTMAMFDFSKALITCRQEANTVSLKRWVVLMTHLIMSSMTERLVSSTK